MSRADPADELAIRDLVARYADSVARADEKAWSATWAKDGEWHVLGQVATGPDAAVELLRKLMRDLRWAVQIPSGGIIEVSGDAGSGRWSITEYLQSGDGSPMLNIGVYQDRYRREEGEWRFARRRFDSLYMGPPDLSAPKLPHPPLDDPEAP